MEKELRILADHVSAKEIDTWWEPCTSFDYPKRITNIIEWTDCPF